MTVNPSTHQVVSIANIVYGGIEEHAVSGTRLSSCCIYSSLSLDTCTSNRVLPDQEEP